MVFNDLRYLGAYPYTFFKNLKDQNSNLKAIILEGNNGDEYLQPAMNLPACVVTLKRV